MSSSLQLRFSTVLILSFLLNASAHAQEGPQLRRQTVGMAGASIALRGARNWHIQSTTGQGGAIGTTSAEGLTLRQGFIQPVSEFSGKATSRELEVTVFPNPSPDIFNIQLSIEQIARIEVLDLSGRWLYIATYEPGKNNFIDLRQVAAGVYLIKIDAERQHYKGRIVKL